MRAAKVQASAQSCQNLRCSLIQAVSQEEPSDRKPDPWPLWMAGHAQLKFVRTECSKTQIRLTRPIYLLLAFGVGFKGVYSFKILKSLVKKFRNYTEFHCQCNFIFFLHFSKMQWNGKIWLIITYLACNFLALWLSINTCACVNTGVKVQKCFSRVALA